MGTVSRRTTKRTPIKTRRIGFASIMGTIKNGHYIRECRSLKNWKKEEEGNNEANLVEDIVAMVLEIQGL